MYRHIYKPGVDKSKTLLPVNRGGTGENTIEAAKLVFNLVPKEELGLEGKTADLDDAGKLYKEKLPESVKNLSSTMTDTVTGVTTLPVGKTTVYEITDYNSFEKYEVSAIMGTVSISGNKITYAAGPKAGDGGFYLNNRKVTVQITGDYPVKPVISYPVEGQVGVLPNMTAVASAFISALGNDTQLSADWFLSKDPKFTSYTKLSLEDMINKVSYPFASLELLTDYYLKCRYRGVMGGVGAWSDPVHFKTTDNFPMKPTITSPTANQLMVSITPTIVSTSMKMIASTDPHLSTDWQIATDVGFTQIVKSSLNDTVNKTSINFTGLTNLTEYYVRCRHGSTNFGKSEWSDPVHFRTISQMLQTSFTVAGTYQFKVPDNVYQLPLSAIGGGSGGGCGDTNPSVSGASAVWIDTSIPVIPGEILTVIVAGGGKYGNWQQGGGGGSGYFPGGSGGYGSESGNGSGGGGATVILRGGSILVVAGGAGGVGGVGGSRAEGRVAATGALNNTTTGGAGESSNGDAGGGGGGGGGYPRGGVGGGSNYRYVYEAPFEGGFGSGVWVLRAIFNIDGCDGSPGQSYSVSAITAQYGGTNRGIGWGSGGGGGATDGGDGSVIFHYYQ